MMITTLLQPRERHLDKDFWHQRWQNRQIGFHLDTPNPSLIKYWQELGVPAGSQVFVPLCGKSLDMGWLGSQGYRVLGVELSEIAVEEFFTEHQREVTPAEHGPFAHWGDGQIDIFCGDFFHTQASHVADIKAVFDRAALVALPPAMRQQYADHLIDILPAGTSVLLVTLQYPQSEMDGPPFSVSDEEVHALFSRRWHIEKLETIDMGHQRPHLSFFTETVYCLKEA